MPRGWLTYSIVLLMLLTAGIVKLSTMLRRPRVNRLCILALMVMLGGWMTLVFTQILSKELSGHPIVSMIFGLTGVAALVTALALSIAGLMRDRSRYNEFVQGKGQGVTALILSILLLTITGLTIGLGWTSWWSSPRKSDLEIVDIQEFGELNFRIGKPDFPWVRMQTKDAQALYYCARPDLFMTVVAEPNGVGATRDDLQELGRARLQSTFPSVEETHREFHELGGASFMRITYKVGGLKGSKDPMCYEQWLAGTSHHVYQINCWSEFSSMDQLRDASKAWMDTFALLDPVLDTKGHDRTLNENPY